MRINITNNMQLKIEGRAIFVMFWYVLQHRPVHSGNTGKLALIFGPYTFISDPSKPSSEGRCSRVETHFQNRQLRLLRPMQH